jgi:cyclic pyranopterin phosphate synthase
MILVDQYGRRVTYLRISLTDRCNLRCVYCMPAEGVQLVPKGDLLSFEEIVRFVGICCRHGLQKVRLTGGEPTIRKDLVELVRALAALGTLAEINLTTNGLLLPQMAESLAAAGLSRVNLSLDTLRPERFETLTRRPGHAETLAGLDAAQKHFPGRRTQINVVLLRSRNGDELLDFARFAQERDLMVRFIEFMPLNATGEWSSDEVVPSAEARAAIESAYPLEPVEIDPLYAGPAKKYRFVGRPGGVGFITPISQDFCAWCNRMRLSADGRIRPCLLDDYEVSVRDLLRAGASDAEVEQRVFFALQNKVEKHRIGEADFHKPQKAMVSIGG